MPGRTFIRERWLAVRHELVDWALRAPAAEELGFEPQDDAERFRSDSDRRA